MVIIRKTKEIHSTSLSRCDHYGASVLRRWVITAVGTLWALGWVGHALGEGSSGPDPFASVQRGLIHDGFDYALVKAIYSSPKMLFDQQGVTAYFLHREATLDYDQFLSQASIDSARDYLEQRASLLEDAWRRHGVEREIIAAILLVESRLGTLSGYRSVLNTLSTLAALGDLASRDMVWHSYVNKKASEARASTTKGSEEDTSEQRAEFEKWASCKSAWAYSELKAYLRYVTVEKLDPFSVHGSYAGAFGIAQFVPSSVLEYGLDGNKDGQVNLSDHMDAIESVANYLKQHGWKPGLGREEAFRVLLCYNRSTYYANTILEVAERLSGFDFESRPEKQGVAD